KRSQRHRHHRVPTEQTEKRSLSRVYANDLEQLTVDQHQFVDRTFRREKRIGNIITDHHNIGAVARLEFVKESPGRTIDCRGYDEIRRRPKNEDVVYLVAA